MEVERIGTQAFLAFGTGAVFAFVIPIGIAVVWCIAKKEKLTTVLVGAATFLLFALILEKPIQNVLIAPAQMGLPEHAVARFVSARPVLWAFIVGLFPGVFEESGRFIAFKTVLRKRKNRETSISHGIGHGGMEVIVLLGVTYIADIAYGVMINTGAFQTLLDKTAAQMPDQVGALIATAEQIGDVTFAGVGLAFVERAFAFLFHTGASILVFYACRDREKSWLYPLAVLLHTAMDFVAGLYMTGVVRLTVFALEAIIGLIGILVFCGAFFLLYKRDKGAAPAE